VVPAKLGEKPQVLVTVFDDTTLAESLKAAVILREAGLRTVVYPEADKMGKQFKFADKLDIPVAVILGPDEVEAGQVAVKNLKTRDQVVVERSELVERVEKFLPSAS
jgi:histidyl-tRNA synthetase